MGMDEDLKLAGIKSASERALGSALGARSCLAPCTGLPRLWAHLIVRHSCSFLPSLWSKSMMFRLAELEFLRCEMREGI